MNKTVYHLIYDYYDALNDLAACGQVCYVGRRICPIWNNAWEIECEECRKSVKHKEALIRLYFVFNNDCISYAHGAV